MGLQHISNSAIVACLFFCSAETHDPEILLDLEWVGNVILIIVIRLQRSIKSVPETLIVFLLCFFWRIFNLGMGMIVSLSISARSSIF